MDQKEAGIWPYWNLNGFNYLFFNNFPWTQIMLRQTGQDAKLSKLVFRPIALYTKNQKHDQLNRIEPVKCKFKIQMEFTNIVIYKE